MSMHRFLLCIVRPLHISIASPTSGLKTYDSSDGERNEGTYSDDLPMSI